TLARQGGKSWFLSDYALWRIGSHRWPAGQNVIHFGNILSTCEKVQAPARRWAHDQDGWLARESNGQKLIKSPKDSFWNIRSLNAIYGESTDLALGDEAWALNESLIAEGVEPTMVERENSQLLLTSTAHRLAK